MSSRKILLVEEDAGIRTDLAGVLVRSGCIITEASNGEAAQYLSLLGNFNLVISDLEMPDIDGINFAQFIKNEAALPLILLTSLPPSIAVSKASEAGASSVLYKPVIASDLLDAVGKILPATSA